MTDDPVVPDVRELVRWELWPLDGSAEVLAGVCTLDEYDAFIAQPGVTILYPPPSEPTTRR